jgi:CspA family cold shock protein
MGSTMTVSFEPDGLAFVALNGGPTRVGCATATKKPTQQSLQPARKALFRAVSNFALVRLPPCAWTYDQPPARLRLFENLICRASSKGARTLSNTLKGGTMATGTVKWFNSQKGYGFIQPDQGGKDIFVHISAVERSQLGSLAEGQKIAFELQRDRKTGRESAVDLRAA